MNTIRLICVVCAAAIASACDRSAPGAAQASADSAAAAAAAAAQARTLDSILRAQPGFLIDSTLPISEQIREFRAAVGGTPVTRLAGGSPSRDSLFRRFVRAVEARDTTAFRQMIVSAREFIDLVYPESPFVTPRFHRRPGLLWGQMTVTNTIGLERLLARRGGQPLGALDMTCADRANAEGKNLIWNECQVRVRDANGTEQRERLFGSILERAGQFKFLSYVNQY